MTLAVILIIKPRLYALEVIEIGLVCNDALQDFYKNLDVLDLHLIKACLVVEERLPETLLPMRLSLGQPVLLFELFSALADLLCAGWTHFSGSED